MSSPVYRIGDYYLDWYGNRPNLYIHWREGGGTRRVSTGTAVREEAIQELKRFVADVEAPAEPDQITVGQILDAYERHQDNPNTSRRIKPARAWFGAMKPRDIRPRDTEAFVLHHTGRGCQEASTTTWLILLRAALNWAAQRGGADDEPLIDKAPKITFTNPRDFEPRDRWLTREEVDQWIAWLQTEAAANQLHVEPYVRLALATAARPGAVLDLTWEQVRWDENLIDLKKPLERKRSRNKRRGTVPMGPKVRAYLEGLYENRRTPYVIDLNGRAPIRNIYKAVTTTAAAAGLFGIVTPYVLRHTAATWMAQKGVPIERIAEHLGHADIETTRRHYLKHYPDYLRDSAAAVDV